MMEQEGACGGLWPDALLREGNGAMTKQPSNAGWTRAEIAERRALVDTLLLDDPDGLGTRNCDTCGHCSPRPVRICARCGEWRCPVCKCYCPPLGGFTSAEDVAALVQSWTTL